MGNNRREFLQQFASTGVCLFCSGALGSLINGCEKGTEITTPTADKVELITGEPVVTLNNEPALQNTGGAIKKRFSAINNGNTTIIIIRLSASSFAAYDARCTHEGTIIELPVNGVMTCLSHGSKFNASTGNVIQGPAAAALGKFTATYNNADNTVTIS